MYNDFWMAEQGFGQRPPQGDLSDLISHRYEAGEVITVGPDDTLLTAVKRMRAADVSQVPVVDEKGRPVGILDESDVLVKVHHDPDHFNNAVKTAMTDRLETLSPGGENLRSPRRLRSRPRRHCHGRRQVSRADHAERSALLSAAPNAAVEIDPQIAQITRILSDDEMQLLPRFPDPRICVIRGTDTSHEKTARHRHPRHPRRAIPRSIDRRDHDADLPDIDLRPAEPGQAQRLRLLALDQSDPQRLRALHCQSRKRNPRLGLCLGPRGHGDGPGWARQRLARGGER